MRTTIRVALLAVFASTGCDNPQTPDSRAPEPEAQPAVEPGAQPEPAPIADMPCVADGDCFAELGRYGRCVGTQTGMPDDAVPAKNACVVAPSAVMIAFPAPEVDVPLAHAQALNAVLAETWRAQGLQIVLRIDSLPAWNLQPDGGWLPQFGGVLYPSWDGTRVAPGVDPIALATKPVACDGARACAEIIFIDSLSAPMRLPVESADACAPSPFALTGAARMTLQVDGAGELVGAELDFGLIVSADVARDTPWGEGTLGDVFSAAGYAANLDTNRDGASDSWELGFVTRAEAAGISPGDGSGQAQGDCLP